MADFRREALILHGLHHPNLPEVRETFEEMGKHFLVMEFIAGRTLLNVLEVTPGFLPEERVMAWARQLFEVIHYLHAQNPPVIYRDVKPANIMLVEGTERLKLIDFGIARFHRQGKMQDTEAFGTAGYAPPEQYGKGQTDQRSDVYALGATLHHLVTRQDPSLNPFNWVPARRLNAHVSPTLENALMVATSLDPARRYRSIEGIRPSAGYLRAGKCISFADSGARKAAYLHADRAALRGDGTRPCTAHTGTDASRYARRRGDTCGNAGALALRVVQEEECCYTYGGGRASDAAERCAASVDNGYRRDADRRCGNPHGH